VFESSVDGLGRTIGRAGTVEVGQHVDGAGEPGNETALSGAGGLRLFRHHSSL